MSNEEYLTQKATDQLTKAATQMASIFALFIFCAAATATDPFFRKNMGERYFTPGRAIVSIAGWVFVVIGAANARLYYGRPSQWVFLVGIIILVAYASFALLNLHAIRERRLSGQLWHSRSRGESIFGQENAIRDFVIEIVVFFLLVFVSVWYALFFGLSRMMGYVAERIARSTFYNRYLDIIDGQIEAQFMETALREGFPPSKTGGIYMPLPSGYRGERRANIARVMAGGPVAIGPTPAPASNAISPPQPREQETERFMKPQPHSHVTANSRQPQAKIASMKAVSDPNDMEETQQA